MSLVNVIVTVTAQAVPLQSGITPGKWRIGYTLPGSGAVIQDVRSDTPNATLVNLTLGASYEFFAQRLGTNNVRIGDEVVALLQVTANPNSPTVDVPLSLAIAVA